METDTMPSPPPLNLAALLYDAGEDATLLLEGFSQTLRAAGAKVAGVVQRRGGCGPHAPLEVVDVLTGEFTALCQTLGPGSQSCRLDPAGLAQAAAWVQRGLAAGADLIVIDKFGKQEAQGQGLRAEISEAALSGIPVLTAVSRRVLPAWQDFTGGYGTTLLCRQDIALQWWEEMMRWGRLYRAAPAHHPA